MYLRKPLVQGGVLRRHPQRCHGRVPAMAASVPPSSSVAGAGVGGDFACYVEAEFTDALFAASSSSGMLTAGVEPQLTSSTSLMPAAAPAMAPAGGRQHHHRWRRSLHCGGDVASLPPTHAILNHLNSSLWLQVLVRLHSRRALSGEDCSGALRHLPAFTYRPLMPWLWSAATLSTSAEAVRPSWRNPRSEGDRSSAAENFWRAHDRSQGKADRRTEVHRCVSPATPAMSCRPAAPAAPPVAAPLTVYTVTDMSTAAPGQWTGIAASVVKSALANSLPATVKELLKVWHDLFFALRSHAVWTGTPEQLRDSAHPQLMLLFKCFYADVRRHSQISSVREGANIELITSEEVPLQQWRDDVIAEVVVRTLTPPILLRKLRGLYRQHRNSAILFAELFALCVEEEETFVCLRSLHARNPGEISAQDAAQPTEGTGRQQLTTTALLMDVDLVAYYATLPGRRYSGLSDAGEQWTVTLQHLGFLLPRLQFLQRCRKAQSVSPAPRGSTPEDAIWQPWRQIASILMNVCVWVSNDNAEAERFGDALRCTVETLRNMSAESLTPGHGGAHKLLAPPTAQEVSTFISCLVTAARDSMRTKAAQLQYGPTDGLLGVYLLSVAVAAVIPASARSRKSPADCQQTVAEVRTPRTEAEEEAAELLHRLRLLVHPSKSTPQEVWSALRRSPTVGEAARYGLVTVGYHLFSDCLMPLASQPKVFLTTQRLWSRLRAWATEVGRPLGLHGEPISVLWKLRWLQQQPNRASLTLQSHLPAHRDINAASALLGRLTLDRVRADSDSVATPNTKALSSPVSWRCGCGFENESISTGVHPGDALSVACVSCVLRTLTPLSWECTSCHNVTSSGVCLPYCLRCGEAHPLVSHLGILAQTPNVRDVHMCGATSSKGHPHMETVTLLQQRERPKRALVSTSTPPLSKVRGVTDDVVRCCWDCGHARMGAPVDAGEAYVASRSCQNAAQNRLSEASDSLEEEGPGAVVYVCSDCHCISAVPYRAALPKTPDEAPVAVLSTTFCSSCGTTEPGYYTAAFTWACGCGAYNSALHAYCHMCSQAAQQPTVTCTHCNHTQSVRGAPMVAGRGDACDQCHYPHPRVLASVTQHRLVRCPACQGRVPSTSAQCPHCACTAVAAVHALLPTEADQPWLCHHCGTTHAVRDRADGQLSTPVHLADPSSSRALLPSLLRAEDGYCTACGTRRLPATTWEHGRLWGCNECGEPFNSELACQRCAALAPGVPADTVYVWRCLMCNAYYPSWEKHCRTAGCGGRRSAEDVCARLCYSPWTCAECGEVTLSSHAVACATCGTEPPTSLRSTSCKLGHACGTTAAETAVVCATCQRGSGETNCSARTHEQRIIPQSLTDANGDVQRTSAGMCAAVPPSPSHPSTALSPADALTTQDSRLAEVETFLLQAAAHPSLPLLTASLDMAMMKGVPSTSPLSHRGGDASAQASELAGDSAKLLTDPTHRDGIPPSGADSIAVLAVEPWEDAYASMVVSF